MVTRFKVTLLLMAAIGILGSCGNYCPKFPKNGLTNQLVFPVELVNRRDTLHLGDTLLFRSIHPLLPLFYNNTYFDEELTITLKYNFSRRNVGNANDVMPEYTYNESIPQQPYTDTYIIKKQTLTDGEYFMMGFIPQDTGLFHFFWHTYPDGSAEFREQNVPDYKGRCDRSTNDYRINLVNLRYQPLAESLDLPYLYNLCIGSVCDTNVIAYAFRVEP